jgi:dihydroneopterin aldolase
MTFLLASVTDEKEAELAVAHGADILGVEDPATEWPAAPDPGLVRAIRKQVAATLPLSAFAGDALASAEVLRQAAEDLAASGIDHVKIALPSEALCFDRVSALAPLASRLELFGVFPAEQSFDLRQVERLAQAGFRGVMLDTAQKPGSRLLDLCDIALLGRFVEASRRAGLLSGLSGSLEAPDVPRLIALRPDILGFRTALCVGGDRGAGLDPDALALLRALILPQSGKAEPQLVENDRVDYRLLTGRPPMPDPQERGAPPDRIFVRDLVLPVRIGAYRSEHAAPQRVRFNVEAWVTRALQAPADMRDILSYDIITDGISRIVGEGHIALVETLAWRIADLVLAEARVTRVIVRVEKLDTGPGAVGIEITRDKPVEITKRQHLPAAGNEK